MTLLRQLSCTHQSAGVKFVHRSLRMYSANSSEEVVFNVENKVGIITLNRPKALNSLTVTMVRQMHSKLKEWQTQLKMVIVEGAGDKAFCAGGDIRAVTEVKGSQLQKDFFREEYLLDHLTGTYRIPYVALIDGIVMGGGVGISVHSPYRVASEKTVFAMPETAIGLVPDVGGSYFLSRLKGNMGMFLALTGQRLKGADCLHAGIASHACASDRMQELKQELIHLADVKELKSVLDKYTASFSQKEFSLQERLPLIQDVFSKGSVEEILQELDRSGGEWGKKTCQTVTKMSPTSLKVTHRQILEGRKLSSLGECLQMEYRLVRRCCEDDDFYEGVRALLVDKDNAPKWNPPTLQQVSDGAVDRYFSRLPEKEELKF